MRAIGIILAGGNNRKMKELSQKRAIGAMPIAGSYRSIDFALSNMSNSHIQKGRGSDPVQRQELKRAPEFIKVVGFRAKAGRSVRLYPCGDCGEQFLVQGNGGCDLSESVLFEEQPRALCGDHVRGLRL